jgi:hypothetical protein
MPFTDYTIGTENFENYLRTPAMLCICLVYEYINPYSKEIEFSFALNRLENYYRSKTRVHVGEDTKTRGPYLERIKSDYKKLKYLSTVPFLMRYMIAPNE